jgi:immune inhibitor A
MYRWFSITLRWSLLLAFFLAPLIIPKQQSSVPAARGLHAMPLPPALMEKLQQEGRSLPAVAARYSRGVDHPQRLASPPKGNFNLLVVAVQFSDRPGVVAPTFFNNLVFAAPGPGVNSVADYFDEISHNTLTLVTLNSPGSLGWQTAPWTYSSYVDTDGVPGTYDDYGWGYYPNNLQGLAWQMIPLLDPLVDFSNYDNDGDGFVDSVVFVHAGNGAELTLSPGDIWSSAWDLSSNNGPGPAYTLDGVWVDNFSFEPEFMVTVSAATSDQTIGVFCHELGHTIFGLPDLYDPDNSSSGVGTWSLMGQGGWNGTPIYNPW